MTEIAMLSDAELEEIERLAKCATPGRWNWHTCRTLRHLHTKDDNDSRGSFAQLSMPAKGYHDEDAAHIARCDPPTALALVSMAQRMKEAEADAAAAFDSEQLMASAKREAEATIVQLSEQVATLREAVDLACGYLIRFEPCDSRVVSDEFVALAAIAAGNDNDACWDVVKRARADLALSTTSPEPKEGGR